MSRKSPGEEPLERLLRRSLGTPSRPPQPGSCPDAETLAAWADGALAGGRLTAAEEHLADCVACQATLAALARATPQVRERPWWQRALSARWLVPVAATATAIAVWVAVPRDDYTGPPEEATQTVASRAGAPQTEPVASAEAPAEAIAERRDNASAALGATADSAPPAVPAGVPASPPPAAQAGRARFGTLSALASPRVEILSPGGSPRWRIGSAGAVEYSTSAGGTWEATSSGVDTDLTAGSSPGGTVCWVVGRAGTVLLTTSGREWRRLAFPVTVDLVAVQATDARTATVTATDGRRFRTEDGGATWESL